MDFKLVKRKTSIYCLLSPTAICIMYYFKLALIAQTVWWMKIF